MVPFPHRYAIDLAAGPEAYGELSSTGAPSFPTAPPREFGGPGDAWSPEQLLLGAVGTCFLFTFRAVAAASGFAFERLDVHCRGTVDRVDHVTRFTEIVVQPRLTLSGQADRDRAMRLLEKAERACLVTASLSTPTRLEPTVETAATTA